MKIDQPVRLTLRGLDDTDGGHAVTATIVATGIGLSADISDTTIEATIDRGMVRSVWASLAGLFLAISCFTFLPLRHMIEAIPDAVLGEGQGPNWSITVIILVVVPLIVSNSFGRWFSVTLDGPQDEISDVLAKARTRAAIPAFNRWAFSVDAYRIPQGDTADSADLTEVSTSIPPGIVYFVTALFGLVMAGVTYAVLAVTGG